MCSWFLRGLGAFFIKRRMDPVQGRRDMLYRSVLHTYMVECLRAGHNMEFFIEGGRTRTGKPYLPKGKLLKLPYIREYSAPSNNLRTLILGEEILKNNKNGFN